MSSQKSLSFTFFLIHKGGKIPPGRPIIAACNSVLELASKYLDSYFQPLIKKLDSFVKDTEHFVSLIEKCPVNKDTILVIMDIRSLYANIPHEEARYVVLQELNSREVK